MARFFRFLTPRRWVFLFVFVTLCCTLVGMCFWRLKGPPSPQQPTVQQAPQVNQCAGDDEPLGAFVRPTREQVDKAVREVSTLFAIVVIGIFVLFLLFVFFLRSPHWSPAFRSRKPRAKGDGPALPPREQKPERIELDLDDL